MSSEMRERDLFVEASLAVHLRGGMRGEVLREHSDKSYRGSLCLIVTLARKENQLQFLDFTNCSGKIFCNLNLVASYMGGRVSE